MRQFLIGYSFKTIGGAMSITRDFLTLPDGELVDEQVIRRWETQLVRMYEDTGHVGLVQIFSFQELA